MRIRPGYRVLLLLLIVIFPFFFFGGPGYLAARSFKAAWDLGHILFFTLASVGLYGLYGSRASPVRPARVFVQVSLLVFGFGLLIELIQMYSAGRSPDIFDLLRNQLGALIGFVFFSSLSRGTAPFLARGLQAVTILFLLCVLWPVVRATVDEWLAVGQFPQLSDFETPLEARRWNNLRQLQRVARPVRHGNRALRVQLSTEKYSGTSLFYVPRDWSGYQWLNFSVYNPLETQLSLHSRIHDRLHGQHGHLFTDRFYREFILQPGWNDLRISLAEVRLAPVGREMDMQQIEGFGIYVVRLARPLVIYLDNVYLSK